MRKLLYTNYAMMLFLLLMSIIGLYQAVDLRLRYGFSYTVTTIINGVETSRVVTFNENLFTAGFIFILFLVMLLDTWQLREHSKNNK